MHGRNLIEGVRRGLSDWLDWMGLVDSGPSARLDRYIGYYNSYADRDQDIQKEARNVAKAVVNAVRELRNGNLLQPDRNL